MVNRVIFIGGATASGKSSLTKALNGLYNDSISFRRVNGFFELAKKRGIEKERAFSTISSENVDDYFVSICKNNLLVFSDVHYAVQMNRNNNGEININDLYVPTISKSLIDKLKANNINISVILMECSSEICYNRAMERYTKGLKEMRNVSLLDTQIEILSEKKEFLKLINLCDNYLILNSEQASTEELVRQVDKILINSLDNKVLKKERGRL